MRLGIGIQLQLIRCNPNGVEWDEVREKQRKSDEELARERIKRAKFWKVRQFNKAGMVEQIIITCSRHTKEDIIREKSFAVGDSMALATVEEITPEEAVRQLEKYQRELNFYLCSPHFTWGMTFEEAQRFEEWVVRQLVIKLGLDLKGEICPICLEPIA